MVNARQIKIKMLARILKNVSNVLFWVLTAGFVIFLIASIVISFIPGKNLVLSADMSGSLSATLEGTMLFNFNPATNGNIMIKPVLQATFMWISFASLMSAIVLFELKRILKSVVEDNPFEKSNSKHLTIIAIVLMIGATIIPVFEGRLASTVIEALKIGGINIGYSFNWTLLLTGILILILAGVFQYGNYLQEEVDSTL